MNIKFHIFRIFDIPPLAIGGYAPMEKVYSFDPMGKKSITKTI